MTHHHALMGDDVSGADGAPVGDEIAAPETVEPEGEGSIVDSVRQVADELAEGWDRMRGTIGPFSVPFAPAAIAYDDVVVTPLD